MTIGKFVMRSVAAGLVAASALFGLTESGHALERYTLDARIDTTQGWTIAYNKDRQGCFAYAEYNGGYRIWFGFDGRSSTTFLAVANQKWSGISAQRSYKMVYDFDDSDRWKGNGDGFVLRSVRGVEVSNLKVDFLEAFAYADTVTLSTGGIVERLSLYGTRSGLQKVIECQRAVLSLQPRGRSASNSGAGVPVGVAVAKPQVNVSW